jgi:hypothetical protein
MSWMEQAQLLLRRAAQDSVVVDRAAIDTELTDELVAWSAFAVAYRYEDRPAGLSDGRPDTGGRTGAHSARLGSIAA